MSDEDRRYREKSRTRERSRDPSRHRDSSRVRDRSRDREERRGHKKSNTLSVDPYAGSGSRSRGTSPARDRSPVGETLDRSFVGGGYGGTYQPVSGYGGVQSTFSPVTSSPSNAYGQYPPPEAPVPPAQRPYGAPPPPAPYGSGTPPVPYGGGTPYSPPSTQPPYSPPSTQPPYSPPSTQPPYSPPSTQPPYSPPSTQSPYGSALPPTPQLHTSPGGYQYPIPPPPQGYIPPPPPPSETQHTNPDYWSASGGPSSSQKPTSGSLGGPGSYVASAPPHISPGLGSHKPNPLPPPSPNIGPHYAASPSYAPPTQYGSGGHPPSHQPSHGHSSSLSLPNMSALSLGGASPALQPYQGTYQNISPLPSPSASPISYSPNTSAHDLGTHGFSLGAPLVGPPPMTKPAPPPADRDEDYDPTPHAKELLACLNHNISRIDPGPIIKILPRLTPAQLVALRAEYKRLFHQVNIAKHIKMQCGTGAFGKIAWAVALGPYESEGWFANSWYQKAVSRNELLIEALVGKTVQEIRKIKKGFKDDKYGNSLERAIKSELGAHKFRGLILMTLDTESGIREEEPENQGYLGSVWGHAVQTPGGVKMDKVHEDVKNLYDVLDGRPGTGESVLMQILLCRSHVHLREVIRWYRQMYGKDLSRVVIKHSPNLVGESLTHLLSGIIDKPLRDAKLLEDAINSIVASDNPKDDLFISRCVRVHWDRGHCRRVKVAYHRKYQRDLIDRIREVTREDRSFRDFLTRMLE